MLKLTKNLPSCATDVAYEFPEAEKKDILKLFPKNLLVDFKSSQANVTQEKDSITKTFTLVQVYSYFIPTK